MIDLSEAAAEVLRRGPDRVLVDEQGLAVTSRRAREDYGVIPDLIFIRGDGWSMGAEQCHADCAAAMWWDEWIGVLVRPSAVPLSFAHWKAKRNGEGSEIGNIVNLEQWRLSHQSETSDPK